MSDGKRIDSGGLTGWLLHNGNDGVLRSYMGRQTEVPPSFQPLGRTACCASDIDNIAHINCRVARRMHHRNDIYVWEH